ncbi:hypothetical protein PMAYCL1PPCAC_03226, partial [Pristionchus mayeri]
MDELNRKGDSTVPLEKKMSELTEKVDEEEKKVMKDPYNVDWACCPKAKNMLLEKLMEIAFLRLKVLETDVDSLCKAAELVNRSSDMKASEQRTEDYLASQQ